MKGMLAVAKLISRQKLRKIDILTEDVLNSKTSKFKELYDALQAGTIRNDREAAQLLYQAGPTDTRYRQLKSRFKKRLLNTLFFVDQNQPHQTSFDQTYHNCQREWSLTNILRARGAEEAAFGMAKNLLACCEKYGFSELSVQSARFMADYAAQRGDVKTVVSLQSTIKQYTNLLQLEMESERILRELVLILKNHELNPSCQLDLGYCDKLGKEISELTEKSDSTVIRYDYYEAFSILHKIYGDREAVVNIVNEAIDFSQGSPRQMQEVRLNTLRMRQLNALTELRDLKRGQEAIKAFDASQKAGTEVWLEIRKAQIALYLMAFKPAEALKICNQVSADKSFEKLGAPDKEVIQLLAALAYISIKKSTYSSALDDLEGFDPAGFLRKAPTFGGEHQRLNAWRLIVKAVLYKIDGNELALSECISKLRHLSVKQLNPKKDVRFIAFAQLLYRLERKAFNGEVDRIAERSLHDLSSLTFYSTVDAQRFEPIDLESLLDYFGVETQNLVAA